jgi:hypothetical protein
MIFLLLVVMAVARIKSLEMGMIGKLYGWSSKLMGKLV